MLKITQVKSTIGGTKKQRDTIASFGLRKIGQSVEREDRPEVRGMLDIVAHLVTVEEA